jgi:hypothetical protein
MRNEITVFDPKSKTLSVGDLVHGQMFKYRNNGDDGNIYMKVMHNIGPAVVHLPTGKIFSEFNLGSPIEIVQSIKISSP